MAVSGSALDRLHQHLHRMRRLGLELERQRCLDPVSGDIEN
ncbi:MAG: hypothetical protein VKI63_09610 [Cyanobium sp.]|nr:hypothetical protein [Cyanobium sp.]